MTNPFRIDKPESALRGDSKRVCAECGRAVEAAQAVQLGERNVCPECKAVVVQRLREGATAEAAGVGTFFREGSKLVMEESAQLPSRCIKCNAPIEGEPVKKKLRWYTPWLYLLLVIQVLVFIAVALIMTKRATVYIPVCNHHKGAISKAKLYATLLFIGALVTFFLPFTFDTPYAFLVPLILFLGAIVVGTTAATTVVPVNIKDGVVTLKGASNAFLDSLDFR